MSQQEKLKICAEALGLKYINHIVASKEIFVTDGVIGTLMSYKHFANELQTTLGIATWQDRDTKMWFASKNYDALQGFALVNLEEKEGHKDFAQAVIDCVAGDKS